MNDSIFSCISSFIFSLCDELQYENHMIRPVSIYFFRKASENIDQPRNLIIRAISSLYLSGKILNTIEKSSYNIIKSSISVSKKKDFCLFPSHPPVRLVEDHSMIYKEMLNDEIELINELKFDFSYILPECVVLDHINQVLDWHLESDDQKRAALTENLLELSKSILKELHCRKEYYDENPLFFAAATVLCACNSLFDGFEEQNTKAFCKKWLYLEENIEKLFKVIRTVHVNPEKVVNDMQTWHCITIWPSYEGSPCCSPPPLDSLSSYTVYKDAFSGNWADHAPKFEPPPLIDESIDVFPESQTMQIPYYMTIEKKQRMLSQNLGF